MEGPMRRTNDRYHGDIRTVLEHFYQAGDTLTIVKRFFESRKCQMCGDKVTINDCFVLRNDRTGEQITCGKHCIVNYFEVLEQMGQTAVILCPESNKRAAARINQMRPNSVTVISEFDGMDERYEEIEEDREMLLGMGLDPDDPDFTELAPHGMSGDEGDDEEVESEDW